MIDQRRDPVSLRKLRQRRGRGQRCVHPARRPALLIGEQLRDRLEKVEVRLARLGPDEPAMHRGHFDERLHDREQLQALERERVRPAHVRRARAIEDPPHPFGRQRAVRIRGLLQIVTGRAPHLVREPALAEPREQHRRLDTDTERDRIALLARQVQPSLRRAVAEQPDDIRGEVDLGADLRHRIDQPIPRHRVRLAGEHEAVRLDRAAVARPHAADGQLDLAVLTAARIGEPLLEQRPRRIDQHGREPRIAVPRLVLLRR